MAGRTRTVTSSENRLAYSFCPDWRVAVAKPNYAFEKRQRELAKKQKKEAKRQKKTSAQTTVGLDIGSSAATRQTVCE
jgi:hypothetical protein